MKIKVKDFVNSDSVLLRKPVDAIVQKIEAALSPAENIEIDFTGIESISRASAHSFISFRNHLAHSNFQANFVNISREVQKMFEVVAETNTKDAHHRPHLFPVESSFEDVSNEFIQDEERLAN